MNDMVCRHDSRLMGAESDIGRFVFTYQFHIGPVRNFVFHPYTPKNGVDQQAAKPTF